MDFLDSEFGLLHALKATTCLTRHHIDSLQTIPDKRKRNGKLLDMIKHQSVSQLNEFIECLKQYQKHLEPFLTGDEGKSSLKSQHYH